MRAHKTVAVALLIGLLGYAASPYVALWRLEKALDAGDTATLERSINWSSLRTGLKQDIADGIIGPVQLQAPANTLPPFGASFISGIADSAVEHDVTPQNLIAIMRQMRAADTTPTSMFDCFRWAFFDSPTSFTVVVNTDSADGDDSTLRVRLELHGGTWTVMRAWVPQDMVERASQRT
jgi:hypothetical protein